MISIALFFAKLKSILSALIAFFIKHWRVLIPFLIVVATILYIASLRASNARLEAKYNDYVQLNVELAEKRKIENAQKADQGKREVAELTELHNKEIELILLDKKGLKNEVDTNQRTIANLRDRLSKQISDYEAARLSSNDVYRVTESDSNATIFRKLQEVEGELMVCREAGAVAASDYNFCKAYVDKEQARLGVEP